MKKMKLEVKGLNYEQILEVVTKVVQNHKNKTFGNYTPDDIMQQAWIIILEKLPLFDGSKSKDKNLEKGLENWLNTVVSNRLHNFYRDKCLVQKNKDKNLSSPLSINSTNTDFLSVIINMDMMESKEIINKIIDELDVYMIDILESLLSGEYLCFYYRNRLNNKIKDILESYDGEG